MQSLGPLKKRRPLRELEWLMCHALGICLSDEEARKLARQTGLRNGGTETSFEIHNHLIEGCKTDQQIARKVQKFLNQKYGWIMRRVDRVDTEGVEEIWRELIQQGEMHGAFWAIMTREDITPGLLRKIFGEVHMTCFGNVAKQSVRIRKIASQGGELENLKQRLTKTQDRLSRVRSERDRLKGEIREKEKALLSQKGKLDDAKKPSVDTIMVSSDAAFRWRQKRTALVGKLQQERNLRLLLEKKVKELENELREIGQKENSGQEINLPSPASSHATTFSLKLKGKKVLFVGGLDRMESRYRQLIESLGGSFDYHSGYYGKGGEAFENKVKRADVVLLPINCVSHFASSMAKRLCKKEDKPFIPLSSTGLTSVYRALGMGIEGEVGDES